MNGSRAITESVHNSGCPLLAQLNAEVAALETSNWRKAGFDFPEQLIFEIEIRRRKIEQALNNNTTENHGTE